METSNEKKNRLLGMPYGTATNKLRKMLLFDMATRLDEVWCHRCSYRITKLEEFSIEHTIPWQGTKNPKETFFDISKISFSHLSCNVAAGNGSKRKYYSKEEEYKAEYEMIKNNPDRYYKKLAQKRQGPPRGGTK